MDAIKALYQIGCGPSSSHTIGPRRAAETFRAKHPLAARFHVTLYGSLASTGKGHMTDVAVPQALAAPTTFDWHPEEVLPTHPNGIKFEAFDASGQKLGEWVAFSVGGGAVVGEGETLAKSEVYLEANMVEILALVEENGETFWEYAFRHEPDLEAYLGTVWDTMKACIKRGLAKEGVLPGSLRLPRKAASFFIKAKNSAAPVRSTNKLFAYALAVAEENAAGGEVVTAPTCGSGGVLPAVLYNLQEVYHVPEEKVIKGLATAGLFGNVVKHMGSISGAEVGCQGEIGTACAMASAAATQLMGGTPAQIEYAAEMGLEHHLGLTCDPVAGLVQIPCIERNPMGASRAVDCALYALLSDGKHRVSFDEIIQTMVQTGRDLARPYRETAEGGLAKYHKSA